jgi:hypothetical protein
LVRLGSHSESRLYRCFTAKGRERVPLFSEFGLVSQLGTVEYARARKFREKLEGWLAVIRTMWPECPARIDADGTGLLVDSARALLTEEAINARQREEFDNLADSAFAD